MYLYWCLLSSLLGIPWSLYQPEFRATWINKHLYMCNIWEEMIHLMWRWALSVFRQTFIEFSQVYPQLLLILMDVPHVLGGKNLILWHKRNVSLNSFRHWWQFWWQRIKVEQSFAIKLFWAKCPSRFLRQFYFLDSRYWEMRNSGCSLIARDTQLSR